MSISTESPPQAIALTSWQEAFVLLANHCIACPTCSTRDAEGWNLNLPCAERNQLHEEYRQAWRAAGSPSEGSLT